MVEPPVTEDLDQSIRDAQDKFNAGMGADGDASPYPLLRELRAQSPVHAGWPEMGMIGNSGDGTADVHRLHLRRREGDLHRQHHLQYAVLRRCRTATSGSDHPRDAGTRTRGLSQAARVRIRPFVDEALGRRARRSAGGRHDRQTQGRQARRPGRHGLHAHSGAGNRCAAGSSGRRRRQSSIGSPSICSDSGATWTVRCGLPRR